MAQIVNKKIKGTKGDDVLTNKNTGYTEIEGYQGNDVYVINNLYKSATYIENDTSGNDTINIKNIDGKDLMFIFDYYSVNLEPEEYPDDGLFIISKSNAMSAINQFKDFYLGEDLFNYNAVPQTNMIAIADYFGDTNNGGSTYGEGYIETINAITPEGVKYTYNAQNYISTVSPKLKKFLQANGFNTSHDVLFNGTDEQRLSYIDICKNTPMNYTIIGTAQNDNISGESGNDTITGAGGDDTIKGGNGNDSIKGGDGKDSIDGGSGNDKLYGDAGNDTIKANDGKDQIWGGKGNDKIYFQKGDNLAIFANGDGKDTIISGTGNDTLKFTGYADITALKNGINVAKSGDNLVLKYNSDKDTVTIEGYFKENSSSVTNLMSKDNKTISLVEILKAETFELNGQNVTGTIYQDSITGTTNDDTLKGGNSNDTIKGGDGKDSIDGGSGNDKLYGDAGNDTIKANDGKDQIWGGKGNDKIYFQKGDNLAIFANGDGKDTIISGTGNDTLKFTGYADIEKLKSGINVAKSGDNLVLKYNSDKDTVTIEGYFKENSSSINALMSKDNNTISLAELLKTKVFELNGQNVTGTIYQDSITGTTNDDTLKGGNSNDTIKGGDGKDSIDGGSGNDKLYGDAGNDTIKANDGKDQIWGGKGNDKIYFQKGDNLAIFANGDGKDTIISGTGNDTLKFTGYADIEKLKSSINVEKSGDNLVLKYNSNKDTVTIEGYFKENSSSVNALMSKDNNTISLAELLKTKVFELNGQNVTGTIYQDSITGTTSEDTLKGGNANDTIKGGDGKDSIDGGSGNDKLYGEAGNDTIKAGDGKDQIWGGKGNDTIHFQKGDNLAIFGNGDGKDTVISGTGNDTLKFTGYADITALKDGINVAKSGDNLVLKYNSDKDTVTIKDYFKENSSSVTNLMSKDNKTISLAELLKTKVFELNGQNVTGTIYQDSITGTTSEDTLKGGNANDTIKGGDGKDSIEGGSGNDKIYGGTGNDKINAGVGTNTLYFAKGDGNDTVFSGGGTDTLVFTNETEIYNVTAEYDGKDLVLSYTGGTVRLKDYNTEHSAKYIKVGSETKLISDILPEIPKTKYELANVIMGTDKADTIVHSFTYNDQAYENQQKILKEDYNGTQKWIDKYTVDLSAQAQKVSNSYESVKGTLQNIKWYEYLISNYDNPDYTGDTYFRHWSKEYWQDELAKETSTAYGLRYTWENYRDTQIENGADIEDLYYSVEYARFKNLSDNLQKYQQYSQNTDSVPTFRDIAIAHGYTQENGYQYWENKAADVLRYIKGFTGLKQAYETLLNEYADEHADFAELQANYKNSNAEYQEQYDAAIADILENNANIKAAYDVYQANIEMYNLYLDYAHNYYNAEYLGKDYDNTINGKNYVSFRQEAEAESQNTIIHDYSQKKYRPLTGEEYWFRRAEQINREINGYEGSEARYDYYYRLSKDGNPLSIYYDLLREARDEYNDYADEYNTYVRYNNNWNNTSYIGEYTDDAHQSSDYWIGKAELANDELNGSIHVYNTEAEKLNTIVQYIKNNAPSETALQILTHLTTDSVGGIIIAGNGADDITIGYIDPKAESQTYGSMFAMGQGGNDIYRIKSYSNQYSNIEIYDHEGSNTIHLNAIEFNSGNIGVYANVTLVKKSDGSYDTNPDGSYKYTLENFKTYTGNSSGYWSTMEESPLKNGDAGYALLIVDAETYSNVNEFSYGAMDQKGIKLDGQTVAHLDKIYANDGKYITQDQLNTMFQKTANKLAEMGFDSFMDAMCLDGDTDYSTKQNNLYELTSSENLGSLEWINPTEGVISGATTGLVGTNTNDILTSTSANETFNLKLGNDTVTFTGKFGNDVIQSSSTVDNEGNARQADTLNLKEYSVKDGTLRFSQNGNNLVLTAYAENGTTKKGTVTYKNFLSGADYNSRKFILNAKDHTYIVWFNEAQERAQETDVTSLDIEDWNNKDYNIRFIKSLDNGIVRIYANENSGTYHVLDNTPIVLYTKDGETKEIFSNGNGDDYYPVKLNEETSLIIHDEGGNDKIEMDGGWSDIIGDAKMRFFFDITDEGVVSEAKHIIWKDSFYIPTPTPNAYGGTYTEYFYATDNLIKLLNNDKEHMKGVITFYGDIENIENDNHPSGLYPYSLNYNKVIASTAVDVVPWLKGNHYESVNDALTQLQTEINSKQNEMNEIDTSGIEKDEYGNIIPETVPPVYAALKEERDALQAKVDKLLGFYNKNYEEILYTNMIGTSESESITASISGITKYVEACEGDDTIDLTTSHSNVEIIYDFTRGDGHDTLINAWKTSGGDEDKIYINIGDMNVTPKLRVNGWDLILEMYTDPESTKNPNGSIRFKDYFKKPLDNFTPFRIDTLVIQSTGNEDDVISIKEMIEEQGVINKNIIIGTSGKDSLTGTSGNDTIYTNGAVYYTDEYADVITSTLGNDKYYLTPEQHHVSYGKFTYTVGSGDDTIFGASYLTYLTLNYNDEDISMEFRKSKNNDIRMVFFNYAGEDRGSITIKESDITWSDDGSIYNSYGSSFLNHGTTDTFFIKKNNDDVGTAFKLSDLVKQYIDLGGSLTENSDNPYINYFKFDDLPNGTVLKNSGKTDYLVMPEGVFYEYDFVEQGGKYTNDLIIKLMPDGENVTKSVIIEGYASGDSSLKALVEAGSYRVISWYDGQYEHIFGTNDDDTFVYKLDEFAESDTIVYHAHKGNDVFEFPVSKNTWGSYENGDIVYDKAIINSTGGTQYTDTIKLEDYSLYYNNLRFGYANDGNSITIKGEKEINITSNVIAHKYTDVTYSNFMSNDAPNLKIQMNNGDYSKSYYKVHKYNSVQNLDTSNSFDYEENTAHALYINASSGKSKITSGSYAYAQILTNGGAALNFTGHDGDIIVTNSKSSNDTYNADYLGATLFITDKGGTNDVLNLQDMQNNNFENLFLAFNVNTNGTTDNRFTISYGYKSEWSNPVWNTAIRVLSGKTAIQSGVIVIDAAKQKGKNVGIEHVYGKSSDWSNGTSDSNGFLIAKTTKLAEIDMESWYNAVKQDVQAWITTNAAWMEENGLTSTADVFNLYNNNNSTANYNKVESLVSIYEEHNASMYLMS